MLKISSPIVPALGPNRIMTLMKKTRLDHLIGREVGTATILRELARGGAAVVFVAYQRTLKRQIAVKILPKSFLSPHTSERFQQEAEAAAILSHPNIIQIYEVGETDDFLFLTMQFIQGRPLSEYLKTTRRHVLPSRRILPVTATIDIISKVLDGLDYAHLNGTVHRDIKPANILIEKHTNRPIILDFGIAKVSGGDQHGSTTIQGTPVYMPPEQILNQQVDGRADIYATGVMLFEMLVSDLPLPPWNTPLEFFKMKLNLGDHLFQKRPSEINTLINQDMDMIVSKATSFNRADRFKTCREFKGCLEDYRNSYLKNPIKNDRSQGYFK